MRLHPLPGRVGDRGRARRRSGCARPRAAARWFAEPLELEALDVSWSRGTGAVLARVGGVAVESRAARIAALADELDDGDPRDAEELWAAQRAGQRGEIVRRVSALPSALPACSPRRRAWEPRSSAARASSGSGAECAVRAPRSPASSRTRRPSCAPIRGASTTPRCIALSRRVKERFDPAGTCAPGSSWAASDDGLRRPAPAEPGRSRHLRPLRLLPADLPDLRPLGRGDGLAARADRPHGGGRGTRRTRSRTRWRLHWDRCLGCMACVTACPSGVRTTGCSRTRVPQLERNYRRALRRAALPAAGVRDVHASRAAARGRARSRALAGRLGARRLGRALPDSSRAGAMLRLTSRLTRAGAREPRS